MSNLNLGENTKKMLIGLGSLVIYFILTELQAIPLIIVGLDVKELGTTFIAIYSLIYSIVLLATIALIFNKTLKKDWLDLKKNHKKYFSKYIKYWFLALGVMMISNLIILLINPGAAPGNEEAIKRMFEVAPIYTFISAVFLAPVIEELVFRLSFRYVIKIDWLFIFLSGLTFGSMHIIGTYETPMDLLYIIPYSAPGLAFAYVLAKCKNIYVPIGLHFIHNGLLMSLQVFILIFS